MNIERLTKIKNYLLNPPTDRKYGFNMGAWGGTPEDNPKDLLDPEPVAGECGTIHCISGLANMFWGVGGEDLSAEILGLTSSQASDLFFGRGSGLSLTAITVEQTIQTLDKLIETDEVIWEKRAQ